MHVRIYSNKIELCVYSYVAMRNFVETYMKAIFSHVLYPPEMHVRNYVRACLAFKLINVHILLRIIRSYVYVKHPRAG